MELENRWVGAVGSVLALTFWTASDGRVMLASGSDDQTIRRWDADTGGAVGKPLVLETGTVTTLTAWTDPDGRVMLASGSDDGKVRRWDATAGTPVGQALTGHKKSIWALTSWTAPDGRVMLASGSDDQTIRRWDADTGAPVGKPLIGHTDTIRALASWTASDGRVILASGSDDQTIRRWDAVTGDVLATSIRGRFMKRLSDAAFFFYIIVKILRVPFSEMGGIWLGASVLLAIGRQVTALTTCKTPDGRIILASGHFDGIIRLWDAATGAPAGKPLIGHIGTIRALASWTASDGRVMLASGSDDGTIRLWDTATGAPAGKPLTGHTSTVRVLTSWTASDGRVMLASGGDDGTIRLWDAATGARVGKPLTGHARPVFSLATWISSDGYSMLASAASADGNVQRWYAEAGCPFGDPLPSDASASQPLTSWASRDGRTVLVTGGRDGTIRRWDADAGTPVGAPLRLRKLAPVTVLTSWNGVDGHTRLAAGHQDGRISRWNATTGSRIGKPLGHRLRYLSLRRSGSVNVLTVLTGLDDLILASGGDDGTIQRWDAETGTPLGKPLTAHKGAVRALATWPSADGPILASGGDDGTIQRWDAETGTPLGKPLTTHTGGVSALAAWTAPGGQVMLASGGRDGVIRVWDPAAEELLSHVLVEPIRLRGLADRPAPRDLLDRTALTQAVANLLLWRPTAAGGEPGPSVVTFEGPWGTGKTTIMKLVEDRIGTKLESPSSHRRLSVAAARKILGQAKTTYSPDSVTGPGEYRGALTAWFNPWVCQSSEQVWSGLARSITEAARPVLYPSEAEGQAQRYWLARNAPRIDRFAISRSMLLRVLSPLLGFSVLIGIATALLALAKVNNNTLFYFHHWRVTLGILALVIAIMILLFGLGHTVIRYYGPASVFLPPAIVRSPVLSGSFAENATETAKMLRDPIYVAQSGYLPILQDDTARTVLDLRTAGYDLVVFIDDLDRCSASTTTEVFEAINLFLSGTTDLEAKFVIGLDPAVVAAHLDAAYRDIDHVKLLQYGDDPSPGWAFLRKVVQLPVGAPQITNSAIDQFLGAALDAPIDKTTTVADSIGANQGGNKHKQTDLVQSPSSVQSAHLPEAPEATSRAHRRTGPLERQPEIVRLMKQRLEAQPDRSAREAKRMLNVWQLYQRVLDLVEPLHDDERVIQRACHLFVLAEIITRWPDLQQKLNQSWGGQRGLQILAGACCDDTNWENSLRITSLDESEYKRAVANLRVLLCKYDGTAVANVAAKVL